METLISASFLWITLMLLLFLVVVAVAFAIALKHLTIVSAIEIKKLQDETKEDISET
jgi:hypothetical protein